MSMNDAIGKAIVAASGSHLPHIHSSLSDSNLQKKLKNEEDDEQQEPEEVEAAENAWNFSTSPMLTCLHPHHHLHPYQNIRRNKRSFSFDDTHDLRVKLDTSQQQLSSTSWNKEELLKHQKQEIAKGKQIILQGSNQYPTEFTTTICDGFILQEATPLQDPSEHHEGSSSRPSHSSILQKEDSTRLDQGNPIGMSILYGMINATIVLPVLMSFGSIIYRDEAFQPYLNVLIKLTVISGVVHQLSFSTLSTLPFAVGQVQDAGLIFLSSMAGTIVQTCRNQHGADDETLLATATVGLSLATALLGLAMVLIGKLRLAQWVQMLPTPVVGGYLAFIGTFCGVSGIGLMAGTSQVTWKVVCDKIEFILPGVLGGMFIYSLVRLLRHMAVLPTCIVFLFCLFYLVLWFQDMSVEDATAHGWIAKTEPPPVWYHSWDYLRLDKVIWSALPQLLLTEISMIFVVALSSSLDIAAIELELKRPLDYDSELKMIGISNFVSGITGGYTGSYIFSQSIFTLRAGIRSRLAGYVLAGCEILFLVAPFSILAFVPNFFFGSLLSLICIDLVVEWLIESRHKLTSAEHAICLLTFALILLTGVEYGIVLGVVLYVACSKMGLDLGDTENDVPTSSDESENSDLARSLLYTNGDGHGDIDGPSGHYGSISDSQK